MHALRRLSLSRRARGAVGSTPRLRDYEAETTAILDTMPSHLRGRKAGELAAPLRVGEYGFELSDFLKKTTRAVPLSVCLDFDEDALLRKDRLEASDFFLSEEVRPEVFISYVWGDSNDHKLKIATAWVSVERCCGSGRGRSGMDGKVEGK